MSNTYNELKRKNNETKAEIRRVGETAMKEHALAFFERNPEVQTVMWKQYAPHFNDGEPCRFSVHDPLFSVDKDGFCARWGVDPGTFDEEAMDDDDDEGNVYFSDYSFYHSPTGRGAMEHYAREFNLDEDIAKVVFGDDAKVVATREGFRIEDFSHD